MAKYQRKQILINKPFQLKVAGLLAAIITPLIVLHIVGSSYLMGISWDQASSGLPASTLAAFRQEFVLKLALFEGSFLIFWFLFLLYLLHRIAGPLFKLTKSFEHMTANGMPKAGTLKFRKGDFFPEVAVAFNKVVDRQAADLEKIRLEIASLADEQDLASLKLKLQSLNARLAGL